MSFKVPKGEETKQYLSQAQILEHLSVPKGGQRESLPQLSPARESVPQLSPAVQRQSSPVAKLRRHLTAPMLVVAGAPGRCNGPPAHPKQLPPGTLSLSAVPIPEQRRQPGGSASVPIPVPGGSVVVPSGAQSVDSTQTSIPSGASLTAQATQPPRSSYSFIPDASGITSPPGPPGFTSPQLPPRQDTLSSSGSSAQQFQWTQLHPLASTRVSAKAGSATSATSPPVARVVVERTSTRDCLPSHQSAFPPTRSASPPPSEANTRGISPSKHRSTSPSMSSRIQRPLAPQVQRSVSARAGLASAAQSSTARLMTVPESANNCVAVPLIHYGGDLNSQDRCESPGKPSSQDRCESPGIRSIPERMLSYNADIQKPIKLQRGVSSPLLASFERGYSAPLLAPRGAHPEVQILTLKEQGSVQPVQLHLDSCSGTQEPRCSTPDSTGTNDPRCDNDPNPPSARPPCSPYGAESYSVTTTATELKTEEAIGEALTTLQQNQILKQRVRDLEVALAEERAKSCELQAQNCDLRESLSNHRATHSRDVSSLEEILLQNMTEKEQMKLEITRLRNLNSQVPPQVLIGSSDSTSEPSPQADPTSSSSKDTKIVSQTFNEHVKSSDESIDASGVTSPVNRGKGLYNFVD